MKRISVLFLVILLALGVMALPAAAQDAPEGVWLGTWPYAAPGTHNLSSFATGGLSDNLGTPIYRHFVELPPAMYMFATSEYVPLLAESWGFVDDNTAYEYTIKEGAMWSNGEPVTSQDVVDTFDIGRILGWAIWTNISSVEAVDERTVRFTFQEGKASLSNERTILKQNVTASANYSELAEQARAVAAEGKTSEDQEWIDLATAIGEYHPEELIASGPFTYSLDDVGEAFMTLRWQPNSLYSDSVQFGEIKLWAGETEVSTPLVLSGEIAFATNVYPPATLQAFTDEGIRLVSVPLGYGPGLYFNFANPVFQDVNLRKAVAHAINGEQSALLTNGLGASKIMYYSGILDALTPALLSEEGLASLDQYGYDLAKAEEYMAAAGYSRNDDGKWADAEGNTLTFEYTFPADFADFSAAARDATAQLNDFGWDITERALPWQEAAQAIREGNYDLTVWSWGSGTPFAYNNFRSAILRWNSELAEGLPGWSLGLEFEYDGEMVNLEDLILNSSSTLDEAELLARADFVAKIINDTMFYVPLNEMLSVMPLNESLIAGAPPAGDPIYANPASSGGDLFIVPLFLDGTLRPAG